MAILLKHSDFSRHTWCITERELGILFCDDLLLLYAGETYEIYHCVLESKSFLEKMNVLEHTIPFFLPLRDLENDLLSSNAKVSMVSGYIAEIQLALTLFNGTLPSVYIFTFLKKKFWSITCVDARNSSIMLGISCTHMWRGGSRYENNQDSMSG